MRVLVNADDFGLTKGVTDGIIQAHTHGIVNTTTLMMNGLAVDYAVQQAKKHPSLRVGIHLVLTWGKPISNHVPDLVDAEGNFKFTKRYTELDTPNLEQVDKEWRAQMDAFKASGLPLHHIDSHHHIHGWEPVKDIVVQLAQDYGVPVRTVTSLKDHPGILLTDELYLGFYGDGIEEDLFSKLKKLNTESVEVMTHPAIVDHDLRKISSYTDIRERELEILKNYRENPPQR